MARIVLSILLACILLITFPLISASWDVKINSEIKGDSFVAMGQFIAGASDSATDDLDMFDGRMIENPSYSIPLYSIISKEYFMVDYKSDLISNQSKKWSIIQKGSREFRNLGVFTEKMTWDLSKTPPNLQVFLIDYGIDSTRESIINETNLRESSFYEFQVNKPYNIYRYFDLVITSLEDNNTKIKENVFENTQSSSGGGSGGSSLSLSKSNNSNLINTSSNSTNQIFEQSNLGSLKTIEKAILEKPIVIGVISGIIGILLLILIFLLFKKRKMIYK